MPAKRRPRKRSRAPSRGRGRRVAARRFWITRSDVIGAVFLLLGLGIFVGHWVAERSMHLDHVMAVIAVFSMLVGAYLLSPASVKRALKDIVPGMGRFFTRTKT